MARFDPEDTFDCGGFVLTRVERDVLMRMQSMTRPVIGVAVASRKEALLALAGRGLAECWDGTGKDHGLLMGKATDRGVGLRISHTPLKRPDPPPGAPSDPTFLESGTIYRRMPSGEAVEIGKIINGKAVMHEPPPPRPPEPDQPPLL